MTYLLDTNICIHILKNSKPNLIKVISQRRGSEFFISTISHAELWYGVYNSKKLSSNTNRLEEFFTPFQLAEFNAEDANYFGRLKSEQKSLGKVIGENDLMIASQVLRMDAILVTANEKEFSQIKGLRIENWLK